MQTPGTVLERHNGARGLIKASHPWALHYTVEDAAAMLAVTAVFGKCFWAL